MARGAVNTATGTAWVQILGEQLGVQLGLAIAESMQRTLQQTINVNDIAASLGVRGGPGGTKRRGRPPALGAKALCSVAGCGKTVLARDLCRSHYYKQRYQLQKEGKLVPKARGSKRKADAGESSEAKKK